MRFYLLLFLTFSYAAFAYASNTIPDGLSKLKPGIKTIEKIDLTTNPNPKFKNSKPNIYGSFTSSSCAGSGSTALCVAIANIDNPALLAQTKNTGKTWEVVPLSLNGRLFSVSCTGTDGTQALCVAVGTANDYPLLIQTVDGGKIWKTIAIDGIPKGRLDSVSCSGNSPNAICVASGTSPSDYTSLPIILQTNNSGSTWNIRNIALGYSGKSAVFCGDKTTCVAMISSSRWVPHIIYSNDGGNTWSNQQLPRYPYMLDMIGSINCSDSTCIAVGTSFDIGKVPHNTAIFLQSNDTGKTWFANTPPANAISADIASCSRIQNSTMCTIGWTTNAEYHPAVLSQTTNAGETWELKTINNFPPSTQYKATHCKLNMCIVVGHSDDYPKPDAPILGQTVNGGKTWNIVTIPSAPPKGTFNAASCTLGNHQKAFCIAVGGAYDNNVAPFIAQTTDGGKTWAMQTISGL